MSASPLLTDAGFKAQLDAYRYFVDEKSTCIPVKQFEFLFAHKYGGFLEAWEKRIIKGENGRDYASLQSIGGFLYRFPLIVDNRV